MTTAPRKTRTASYLEEAARFGVIVNEYRAAKAEADGETTPTKKRSWPLPLQDRPTQIEGFPLNANPPRPDVPDYGSMASLKASRARQAERLGRHAPIKPTGPSELRKASTFGNSARQPEKGNPQ